MSSPHRLHAAAAAYSIREARRRLEVLAAAEATTAPDVPDGLRSTVYGQRHAAGGHADPTATLTTERRRARVTTWAERLTRLNDRLAGIADMYRLPPGADPLQRIHTALPGLHGRPLGLLALHLADEDELARGWINQPPYRTRIPGECPGCRRRECLEVTTVGPATTRTVVCVADCRHTPDCPCPGGVEGVRHIWPRGAVAGAAPTRPKHRP
ncbi:hypothetical protein QTQ03_16615 [Micromonospora sp. WMMA1363]|uniref:hypothetical protein n=1 Tax=Micromonospora sp. WMMA1363 TaxID=3053985 RepID=UPI00259CA05B|nr:hypothetical protein [Micromonospora sp. WMMA1363]MDM4721142.1 hypothetical protein [Micromonospora sp. WMMA1363]